VVDRAQAAAIDALRASLQRAVSCLSPAVLVRGRPGRDELSYWTLAERYVPLQGRHSLELSVFNAFELQKPPSGDGPSSLVTSAYSYQLRERGGPEIILFHWHPFANQVPFPHLHMAGGAGSVAIDARRHIPGGWVSLHAVVRFAIVELGVRPLRPDWERILDREVAEAAG